MSELLEFKYCRDCARTIAESAVWCPQCGGQQSSGTQNKSRITAAILAIFLGGLGIHKFYLGQMIWGVIYLLFCMTGVPAVVGLIEGIIYLCMSDESFDKNFVKL